MQLAMKNVFWINDHSLICYISLTGLKIKPYNIHSLPLGPMPVASSVSLNIILFYLHSSPWWQLLCHLCYLNITTRALWKSIYCLQVSILPS